MGARVWHASVGWPRGPPRSDVGCHGGRRRQGPGALSDAGRSEQGRRDGDSARKRDREDEPMRGDNGGKSAMGLSAGELSACPSSDAANSDHGNDRQGTATRPSCSQSARGSWQCLSSHPPSIDLPI
jgi:hypothetical protein